MIHDMSQVISQYRSAWRRYGRSSDSMLMPKGRHAERFNALLPHLREPFSILDYGCGLGFLYSYLKEKFGDFQYLGVDIVPEFIEDCRTRFSGAQFSVIGPEESLTRQFEVVFASGVFNLQTHNSREESKNFAFDTIERLFRACGQFIAIDFLSSNVDFAQERAMHYTPSEVIHFVQQRLGRRFVVRHDILPYEFTVFVWKDDRISRPLNVYRKPN